MFTVILVDDEPWALMGIYQIIPWETLGFKIIGRIADSKDAYKVILREKPDVIVSDIRMPEMTGLELQSAIRKQGLTSEFIIVSGYDDFNYAQMAIHNGVFAYLLKPLDDSEVMNLFKKLHTHLLDKKLQLNAYTSLLQQENDEETESGDIKQVIRYLDAHFCEDVTLKTLADTFFFNANHLSEHFHKEVGMSFKKYLIALRMTRARDMLRLTDKTIADIARAVGYNDYFYFIKAFQKFYDITPHKYRKGGDTLDAEIDTQDFQLED